MNTNQQQPGLNTRLLRTKWQWNGGGEVITFSDSGYVENDEWQQRGLVTRWTVIDKRTVLLNIECGRANDLFAVLTFNDAMTAYDGFNFHCGGRLRLSEQLVTDE